MLKDTHDYKIVGGAPLRGVVCASGAKNAVTKQMVATLLTEEPCVLRNVPRILEVDVVLDMMRDLGTETEWIDEHALRVQTKIVHSGEVPAAYSGVNRIPILMLGPLLHRREEASVPGLGGCPIGARPIDFHLTALADMGADVTTTASAVVLRASKLEGTHVRFAFPSVGATENVLLAAVLAKGTTVIDNAAVEPEVLDLVHFLQQMGALVSVGVERRITIEGVSRLRGADHTAITDRIEAASFAAAAVATDGSVEVVGARQDVLGSFLNTLRKVGGEFEVTPRGLRFFRAHELIAQHVETSVHPGFMTDWQQPLVVLLTQARGASVIHETVYENRFGYTEQLNEMGGQIALSTHCLGGTPCRYRSKDFRHSAVVMGPTPLTGANLEIPDLRAGFAYVMAALVANGESTVRGTRYLERGYEDPVGKLLAMGAQIETCPLSVAPQPTVVA